MGQLDTSEVLRSILEMLKQHALYLHRQHGWLIAIAETVRKHPELAKELTQHPFYDLGPEPRIQKTDVMIQNIDALIQQLKR